MSTRTTQVHRMSARTRVLAVALVVVAVLPIAIFATDFTQSDVLRSARARVRERERERERGRALGRREPQLTDSARRERVRVRRAQIQPSPGSMIASIGFQVILIVAIGAAGRKIFALRL